MPTKCRHLRVLPDKDGKVRVRKDRGYRCEVVVETPVLPASVMLSHDWKWPPRRTAVGPDECSRCPMFKRDG